MFSFLCCSGAPDPADKLVEEVVQQEAKPGRRSSSVFLEEPTDATWKMTVNKAGARLGMDFDQKLFRHGVGDVVIQQVSEWGAFHKASRKSPIAAKPGDRIVSVNRFTNPLQMVRELQEQNHLVVELRRVSLAEPLSPKTTKRRQAFLEYQRERRGSGGSKRSSADSDDADDVSTATPGSQ